MLDMTEGVIYVRNDWTFHCFLYFSAKLNINNVAKELIAKSKLKISAFRMIITKKLLTTDIKHKMKFLKATYFNRSFVLEKSTDLIGFPILT